MKLQKSVPMLTSIVNDLHSKHGFKAFNMAYINDNVNNSMIDNADNGFRWQIWWSIDQETRQLIIAESLPFDTWVGGYADYNDSHLMTLLKKCIPDNLYK